MKIYKVFEVNNATNKQAFNREVNCGRPPKFTIYSNDMYMTAEVEVESELEEEISDEEFDRLVEEKIEEIIETLKTYGRYPEYGVPEYVML